MDGRWADLDLGNMFSNALKARVDALCNELSALIRSEPDFVVAKLFSIAKPGRTQEFAT